MPTPSSSAAPPPAQLGEKGDGRLDHRRVEHVAALRVVPCSDLLAEVVLGHAANLAGKLHYGARMADATPVQIVPASEASWEDIQAVLGTRGDPSRCQCQRYKMQPGESWASVGREELAFYAHRLLAAQTRIGRLVREPVEVVVENLCEEWIL